MTKSPKETGRRFRYHVLVHLDGTVKPTDSNVFSRRTDALKRAKGFVRTSTVALKIEVIDTLSHFDRVIFTWSRYTKAQLDAAFQAEAEHHAAFFGYDDEAERLRKIEDRKACLRANLALNYLGDSLRQTLYELAKQEPKKLYVGKRENVLAEIGEHLAIYSGKYLLYPYGEPDFDAQGAANITEARAIIEEYREHYPTIEVCYI